MVTGGAGSDTRVRVRIFAYLKFNGLATKEANEVARKLVFAMVGKGRLSESVATLAGAAIAKPVPGEAKQAVLVEPKAEPYEFDGASVGKPAGGAPGGLRSGRMELGGLPKVGPGRPGGLRSGSVEVGGLDCSKVGPGRPGGLRSGSVEIGGLDCSKVGLGRPGGGYKAPVAGAGSLTNFAIIEPIMTRREVQQRMGKVLGRAQVQSLAAEVNLSLRLPA